jgi:hypothetical protein
MMRPGLEDEVLMDEQVRREFGHVKEATERIEEHLDKQDTRLSDHFKKFSDHVTADNAWAALLNAHLVEHSETKKHRWVIVSGILLTAASTIGILAVEIIKHFLMKG